MARAMRAIAFTRKLKPRWSRTDECVPGIRMTRASGAGLLRVEGADRRGRRRPRAPRLVDRRAMSSSAPGAAGLLRRLRRSRRTTARRTPPLARRCDSRAPPPARSKDEMSKARVRGARIAQWRRTARSPAAATAIGSPGARSSGLGRGRDDSRCIEEERPIPYPPRQPRSGGRGDARRCAHVAAPRRTRPRAVGRGVTASLRRQTAARARSEKQRNARPALQGASW
jgi:hypothetical protein